MKTECADNNPAPFDIAAVWRQFDVPLRAFVSRRVRSRDAAEDIIQDIYLKIHGKIRALRNPRRIDAWIFQIARNAVADFYRAGRRTVALEDGVAAEEEPREEAAFAAEVREMIRQMVAQLPPIYREALSATELDGIRQVDAARRVGISQSGMKSRVQRGRRLLKRMLLDCCHFELDRRGQVISYQPLCRCCAQGCS